VAELTQWNAILRAVAGYHAFKRQARAEFSTDDVVEYLLRDPSQPRSVLLCVRRVEFYLDDLRRIYGLSRSHEAMEAAEYLREILTEKPISHILDTGLHHYLDVVQVHLQILAGAIGRAFFRDWRPAPPDWMSQSQGQSQSQNAGAATEMPGKLPGGRSEAMA
jgi:uncharacterized alpha-E superfamily protein